MLRCTRNRVLITVIDLAADYQDYAAAFQGLGYLESGITEPLNRFAEKLLDYSLLLKHMVCLATSQVILLTRACRTTVPPSHS